MKSIYEKIVVAKNKSFDLVEPVLENNENTLESGEDALISGFGEFQIITFITAQPAFQFIDRQFYTGFSLLNDSI